MPVIILMGEWGIRKRVIIKKKMIFTGEKILCRFQDGSCKCTLIT